MDVEFIEKLKLRDPKALEGLYLAYNQILYKCCYGMGLSKELGQECVQNTWTTFIDVVANFKGESQIKTFLIGILYNKAHELLRKQKRFQENDPIDDILEDRFATDGHWSKPPLNPEKLFEEKQFIKFLESCLENLPLSQKLAFTLREIQDLDTDEICKALEVNENNLNVLMYRAKNKLRECLESKIS